MNKLLAITGLALLSSTAFAHHDTLGDNPDLYQSPLTEHGPGVTATAVQMGIGDLYASHLANPEDVLPNYDAKPEPWDPNTEWKQYDPDGNLDGIQR